MGFQSRPFQEGCSLQKLLFSILLALASAGVFWQSRGNSFVWDDSRTVSVDVLAARTWGDIWKPDFESVYAPLTTSVQKVVVTYFPGQPARALHTLSLVSHAVAAVALFLILQIVLQSPAAAFFGAAFFAVHPLQVEPVVYASAFGFTFGGMLGLLAIWRYMSYAVARDRQGRNRANPMTHYYMATVFFVLAILALPTAAIIPVFALIFDQLIPRRSSIVTSRPQLWPAATWVVLALPSVLIAVLAQNTAALSEQTPLWVRPFVAADSVSFYLSKMLVPIAIGPDYGRSPTFLMARWWGYVTWILPAMLVMVLLYWRERPRTWYAAATLLFFAGLLPFTGLLMFDGQGFSTVASRYAYLAMVGPALAIGYTVCMPKKTWLAAACVLFVGACGWLTYSSVPEWRNESALWDRAVMVNPGSPVANKALGDQARRAGDWGKAKLHYDKVLAVNPTGADIYFFVAEAERRDGNVKRAAELYRKAILNDQRFGPAHNGLGLVSLETKDYDLAMAEFKLAHNLMPESEEAVRNLGMLHVRKGAHHEAIPHLQRAIELTSEKDKNGLAKSHALLGLAFAGTNEAEKAQFELETSLALNATNMEAHHVLGNIYFAKKEMAKALNHFRQVLTQAEASAGESGPLSLEAGTEVDLRYSYGVALLAQKDYARSLEQLQKVLTIRPEFAEAHNSLGVVNFNLRRFDVATAAFEKALALNPKLADPHYYVGDIARWQGKDDIAIGSYYRAIKIDPRHVDAHNRLGNHFMKKQNIRAAVHHFREALKATPDDQRAQYNLKRAEAALSGADLKG